MNEKIGTPEIITLKTRIINQQELLGKVAEDWRNGHSGIAPFALAVNNLQWLVIADLQEKGEINPDVTPQKYAKVLLQNRVLYSELGGEHPVTERIEELKQEAEQTAALKEQTETQKRSIAELLAQARHLLPPVLAAEVETAIGNEAVNLEDLITLQQRIVQALYQA